MAGELSAIPLTCTLVVDFPARLLAFRSTSYRHLLIWLFAVPFLLLSLVPALAQYLLDERPISLRLRRYPPEMAISNPAVAFLRYHFSLANIGRAGRYLGNAGRHLYLRGTL
jgi:hypothetical protein